MISTLRWFAALGVLLAAIVLTAFAQTALPAGPESFTADTKITTDVGVAPATLMIQLTGYTSDQDRKTMADALKYRGFIGFRPVFGKAPVVGTIQLRERKWNIRWASQQTEGENRKITLATDQAMFFVGGSRSDAKPREGYDMAVLVFSIDKAGVGSGTIALAARVRPNADGSSFILDDYSQPTELTKVTKLRTGATSPAR
jgi:hypothetical protein